MCLAIQSFIKKIFSEGVSKDSDSSWDIWHVRGEIFTLYWPSQMGKYCTLYMYVIINEYMYI